MLLFKAFDASGEVKEDSEEYLGKIEEFNGVFHRDIICGVDSDITLEAELMSPISNGLCDKVLVKSFIDKGDKWRFLERHIFLESDFECEFKGYSESGESHAWRGTSEDIKILPCIVEDIVHLFREDKVGEVRERRDYSVHFNKFIYFDISCYKGLRNVGGVREGRGIDSSFKDGEVRADRTLSHDIEEAFSFRGVICFDKMSCFDFKKGCITAIATEFTELSHKRIIKEV